MTYFVMVITIFTGMFSVYGYPIWNTDLGFLKIGNFASAIAILPV